MSSLDSVLLVSFGGPEGPEDVLPFLENVTRGRNISPGRLRMVAERYQSFGGVSPINQANRDLVAAVKTELHTAGLDLPVYWGNRNWDPLLGATVQAMVDQGHRRALAVVTSAFGSYSGCRQYSDDIAAAVSSTGNAIDITKARLYWNHPGTLSAMESRIRQALDGLDPDQRGAVHLVFTAHSVPTAWIDSSPYVDQLKAAAQHLASACAPASGWSLAYQSRSGSPRVPWLEPDISDQLRKLRAQGASTILVVPLGFVSDHMEVVYDLDVEAQSCADEIGLAMVRVPTVGTHPAFVAALRQLVQEHLDGPETAPLAAIGEAWPNPCPADCCMTD